MVYSAAQWCPGSEAFCLQACDGWSFEDKMARLGSLIGRDRSLHQDERQPARLGGPPVICTTPEPDDEEDVGYQFGDFAPPSPTSSAASSTATPSDCLQELDNRPCKFVVKGTFIQAVPDAPQPQTLRRSRTGPAQLQRAQTDSVLTMQALQAFESFHVPEGDFNGSTATHLPTVTSAPPPPGAPSQSPAARWEQAQAPLQDTWAVPAQCAEEAAWAVPAQGGAQSEVVAWAPVEAGIDHDIPQEELICPVMVIDAALAEEVQKIQLQIEYYLSDSNLQTDGFFHQKISESHEGWLDIDLFMNCNMIRAMGASYEMVQLAALQSAELELREDWRAARRAAGRPPPPLLLAAPALPAGVPTQGTMLASGEHDAEGKRKGQELLSLLMPSQATQDPRTEEVHDADQAHANEASSGVLSGLLRCPSRTLELCLQDPGCRRVQDALEAGGREEQLKVANAIKGSVRKLLLSPQGNHVVQKLVKVLPPEDTGFVAQEILGEAVKVARSQFGCRGIQRLVEKCLHVPSTQAVLEELLGDPQAIRELCKHPFGHYVAQSVLESGFEEFKRRVAVAMLRDLPRLATHKSASYVVEKAMTHCDEEVQAQFCRSLTEAEVVRALAASKGVYVLRAISRKSEELRRAVRRALSDDWLASEQGRAVQASKHARVLLKDLGIQCDGLDAAAASSAAEAAESAAGEEAA